MSQALVDFLPTPLIEKTEGRYRFNDDVPKSIGKIRSFYGNAGILLRAYVYIRMLGLDGLKRVSHDAVLAANYLRKRRFV